MSSPPIPDTPALFLDFDGTLVAIADKPDAVVVAPTLPPLIERLTHATDGAIAVISGRAIRDIDMFIGRDSFAAAGLHGFERRLVGGGDVVRRESSPELATLRERLIRGGWIEGELMLEDKGAGLVVHYRAAPSRADEVWDRVSEAATDLKGLHVMRGKMIVEAKEAGIDKGRAIDAFMREPPFAGRTPVFIGDDVTDEDGFRAVNAMDGVSLKVGEEDTVARWRVPDVAAVHAYLERLADAPGRRI